MADYEPVPLDGVCNAGVDVVGDDTPNPPIGPVTLRGLPFLVGSESPSKDMCLVVPTSSVSVEVGRQARRVIFAHRLCPSQELVWVAPEHGRRSNKDHTLRPAYLAEVARARLGTDPVQLDTLPRARDWATTERSATTFVKPAHHQGRNSGRLGTA